MDKKPYVNNYLDVQYEMIKKYGMHNPETGLHEKTVAYQLGQKIEVRDPYTFKKDNKPLKPFMVNNSVNMFEKEKVVFNPRDKELLEQFKGYYVKSVSTTGLPVYGSENEHGVDAVNLCILIFQQKYGELFKLMITSKVLKVNSLFKDEPDFSRPRLSEKREKETPKSSGIIARVKSNSENSFKPKTRFNTPSNYLGIFKRGR